MGKTTDRSIQPLGAGIKLLTFPFLLLAAFCGFLLSFRTVRRAAYVAVAVLLLFAVEGLLLDAVWGRAHRTLFEAALLLSYGASLLVLVAAWRGIVGRRRLRVRRFESLLALTPAQFEVEIGRLLRDLGYRDVVRVGRAGDLGADLRCRDQKGRTVVVQCKRYGPGRRVGSPDVQAFIGMMSVHHQADCGIFVTTAEFTVPATELARRHNIRLFDGPLLSRMVQEINTGVNRHALTAGGRAP